jgi:hypothetical protein
VLVPWLAVVLLDLSCVNLSEENEVLGGHSFRAQADVALGRRLMTAFPVRRRPKALIA